MRETSEAIAKLGSTGAVATDTTAYDIATAPAALPPITCSYCGGPVGADETHCPECAGEAPPIPFRYDVTAAPRCQRCGGAHLACLPVSSSPPVYLDPPIIGIPITELAKRKP